MSLIYVERLTKDTRGKLCLRPNNWKSMYVSFAMLFSFIYIPLDISSNCFSIFNFVYFHRLFLKILFFFRNYSNVFILLLLSIFLLLSVYLLALLWLPRSGMTSVCGTWYVRTKRANLHDNQYFIQLVSHFR